MNPHRPILSPLSARKTFLAGLAALPLTASRIGAQDNSARLRISVAQADPLMEPYYATELGLFTKAGIDAQIVPQTTGATGITAVVTGAVDIAGSSVVQMASALLHGVQLQYVAGAAMWNTAAPTGGLLVAADSRIQSARDFEGKTLAISSLHDVTHLAALAWLIKNGVDPDKVSFVELFFPAMIPAVAGGRVAGALTVEPFMPVAGDGTKVFAIGWDSLGYRYMQLGFFGTSAWIKANTVLARRYADIMSQTARWANDPANHPRTAEIIEKYAKIPAETTQHRVRSTYADRLDAALIDPILDWAYRVKFTERRVRGREMIATL